MIEDSIKFPQAVWNNMWWENEPLIEKIALIGDSVLRQIRHPLNTFLGGRYAVDFFASSRGIEEKMLLKEIKFFFEAESVKYKKVILNLGGQHGFKKSCYLDKLGEAEFKRNLICIVKLIKEYCKEIIFMSYTPRVQSHTLVDFDMEINNEILVRNNILKEVADIFGIKYIDLYSDITNNKYKYRYCDTVHFEGETVAEIAYMLLKYIFDGTNQCRINNLILWGKEDWARWWFEKMKDSIIFFADSKTQEGEMLCGRRVIDIEELKKLDIDFKVYIAMDIKARKEAVKTLVENGLENRIVCSDSLISK